MIAFSEKAQEMLDDLPSYYGDDPNVLAVLNAAGLELERIEAMLATLRDKGLPHRADDEYDLLARWEFLLGLPVRPEGAMLSERQAVVRSTYRARNTASGADWAVAVDTAIQTSWDHAENSPGAYSVAVTIPNASGYSGGQVQRLLRAITPAHLLLTITTGVGFLVDIEEVDIDTI